MIRFRKAVHEAGHVVASLAFGQPIERVDISATTPMTFPGYSNRADNQGKEYFREEAIISLAGTVAENYARRQGLLSICTPVLSLRCYPWKDRSCDQKHFRSELDQIAIFWPFPAFKQLHQELVSETYKLIKQRWIVTVGIAKALQRKGELESNEIEKIISMTRTGAGSIRHQGPGLKLRSIKRRSQSF